MHSFTIDVDGVHFYWNETESNQKGRYTLFFGDFIEKK